MVRVRREHVIKEDEESAERRQRMISSGERSVNRR